MIFSLKSFYKSKEWENLLAVLKSERVRDDGLLYCEHCGKPIIKAYDCIGHHKVELTEKNVNDYQVSLNSDNIMLAHFRCHNQIHERWGYVRPQQVYLVYGPPCAGKTTWVRETAGSEDIVLDMDNIWQMITVNDRYVKPNKLKANVFGVRDCILDMIRTRTGSWKNAYVIGGYPYGMERKRIIDSLGASPVFVEEEKEICIARAQASEQAGERQGWEEYINQWFEEYTEES